MCVLITYPINILKFVVALTTRPWCASIMSALFCRLILGKYAPSTQQNLQCLAHLAF